MTYTDDKTPFILLKQISKTFRHGKNSITALHNIDLSISQGITLGVIGESGCGKSTLGKIVASLESPTSGVAYFQGELLNSSTKNKSRCQRQMIFQNVYGTLNPRLTVKDSIGEGIIINNLATSKEHYQEQIAHLLDSVKLDRKIAHRYPHELSGGQRQRVGIARALAVNPSLVVCDEPLSALDGCTRKEILMLFKSLKQEKQLTYLFISHDLHAVSAIADYTAVMYFGRIVEYARSTQLFISFKHPYTQALVSATPIADPSIEKKRFRINLIGDPPSPYSSPKGCPFYSRCQNVKPECKLEMPKLKELSPGHFVACHLF